MSTPRAATGSAAAVNPEAGTHAVSLAPGHLEAAQAATRRSWHRFPYYAARYGERGWRFSLSDSGWIETLLALSRSEATSQLLWLRGLLRARGMPSVLLESHLDFLVEELSLRGTDAALIASLGETLRVERRARCTQAAWERQCAALPDCERPRAPGNLAPVLLSALLDDVDAPGTLAGVRGWLADSERFDSGWLARVDTWLRECASGIETR